MMSCFAAISDRRPPPRPPPPRPPPRPPPPPPANLRPPPPPRMALRLACPREAARLTSAPRLTLKAPADGRCPFGRLIFADLARSPLPLGPSARLFLMFAPSRLPALSLIFEPAAPSP